MDISANIKCPLLLLMKATSIIYGVLLAECQGGQDCKAPQTN